MVVFHCHVSLPEGTLLSLLQIKTQINRPLLLSMIRYQRRHISKQKSSPNHSSKCSKLVKTHKIDRPGQQAKEFIFQNSSFKNVILLITGVKKNHTNPNFMHHVFSKKSFKFYHRLCGIRFDPPKKNDGFSRWMIPEIDLFSLRPGEEKTKAGSCCLATAVFSQSI